MNLDTAQNVFSDVDGIYSEQDKREAVDCVFDCIRDLRARVEALERYTGHSCEVPGDVLEKLRQIDAADYSTTLPCTGLGSMPKARKAIPRLAESTSSPEERPYSFLARASVLSRADRRVPNSWGFAAA